MFWIIVTSLIAIAGLLYAGYILARMLEDIFHIHLL
jgi:hypothetical protein